MGNEISPNSITTHNNYFVSGLNKSETLMEKYSEKIKNEMARLNAERTEKIQFDRRVKAITFLI